MKGHEMDLLNTKIQKEWRQLGFYYERDDTALEWKIIGSKEGVYGFCKLLEDYSMDKRFQGISEDKHFGPYSYLKFMTWHRPKIGKEEICGQLEDFHFLSEIVRNKILEKKEIFNIDKEFSNENEYLIKFVIKEDNFDPSSFDLQLQMDSDENKSWQE
jgi:hypothetical protein